MKYFIIVSLSIIFFIGCNSSSSNNYMILDDVKYVSEFPITFSLTNNIDVNLGIIGIRNFCIIDSLLICSTISSDRLWSFFSLPSYNILGKFLLRGNGPFEFVQTPAVDNKTTFFKKNDLLFAMIYDFQKGNIYEMNITESIKTNQLSISLIDDSLSPFLFGMIRLDSTTFFCKEANHNHTQQIRYIHGVVDDAVPSVLQKLNQASIRYKEDINILSTSTKMNPINNLIIEMPIGLNYINLYSLDGAFGKTICVGNKVDNIDKIQDTGRWERIYTFADLRVFDNFWGVLYINEEEGTYQQGREKKPSILLFDWGGKPLAKLNLNQFITSFDIDFSDRSLYAFDLLSEKFYKYDIKDILSSIIY